MKLTIKPGVKFDHATPALARMLAQILLLPGDDEIVITSGSDGKHSANSRHYKGEAIDLRVWNLKDKKSFLSALRASLGAKFTVLDEGDHIHIQVKKGTTFADS